MAFNALKYLSGFLAKEAIAKTKKKPYQRQATSSIGKELGGLITSSLVAGKTKKKKLPALPKDFFPKDTTTQEKLDFLISRQGQPQPKPQKKGETMRFEVSKRGKGVLKESGLLSGGKYEPTPKETIRSGRSGIGGQIASLPGVAGNLLREYGEREKFGKMPLLPGEIPYLTDKIFGEKRWLSKEKAEGVNKTIADTGKRITQSNREWVKASPFAREKASSKMAYDIGSGLASAGEAMGMLLATKNPNIPAIAFGIMAKSNVYEEARESGKDPETASLISDVAGTAEGLLEFVGGEKFLSAAGKSVAKRFVTKSMIEGFQEISQEFTGNVIAKLSYDQKRNIFDNVLKAGFIGALIGGGGASLEINSDTQENIRDDIKKTATKNGMTESEASVFVDEILPAFMDKVSTDFKRGVDWTKNYIKETQPGALSIKEVGGKPTTKEAIARENLEQLAREARKYKTYEKFKDALYEDPQLALVFAEEFNTEEKTKNFYEQIRLQKAIPQQERIEKQLPPQKPPTMPQQQQPQTQPEQPQETAEQSFANMLEGFIKQSKETGTIRSKESGKRVGSAVNAWINAGGGEKGLNAFLSQLKGRYSTAQITPFKEEFINKHGQKQFDELLNKPFRDPTLRPFEAGQLADTVRNIIEKGEIPSAKGRGGLPNKTLLLMRRVYGAETTKALSEFYKRPITFKDIVTEVFSIPKATMASGEWSGIYRQGFVMISRRPWLLPKIIIASAKSTFSPKQQQKIYDKMISDPDYTDAVRFKVPLTGINKELGGLQSGEEQFTQKFINKVPLWVPGLGQSAGIIRASNRAYETALDVGRFDSFKSIKKSLEKKGYNPKARQYEADEKGNYILDKQGDKKLTKDYKEFRDNVKVISYFSGRGDLGRFESIAGPLNTAIFSIRLNKARVDTFLQPFNMKLSKTARVEAWKGLITSFAHGMTLLGLIAGWQKYVRKKDVEVEDDPRSADFGKVRVGKHRWDVWGGHQQLVRTFVQFITGEYKSTTTGFIGKYDSGEFGGGSRLSPLGRFVESKQAPGLSFIMDMIEGEDWQGRPFNLKRAVTERMIPMFWQDLGDALKEMGPGELIDIGIPGFLGMGVQTYGSAGISGIREKIREGTLTDEEWERAISEGIISDDPERQAKIVREAEMPEQVVAFSYMSTEEQLTLLDTFDDDQVKMAMWGANEDTIMAMKKNNPKEWASLGLDKIVYQKNMESEYRSNYKDRGLEPMEAYEQAYKTAQKNMKDPVYKHLQKIDVDWTFPTNTASGKKVPASLYNKFVKDVDARVYAKYKSLIPSIKKYSAPIQKMILLRERDEIRDDLRQKYFSKYYKK